jgi:hypothetical protein
VRRFQTFEASGTRLTTVPGVGVATIKRQNVMVRSLARIVCKQTRLAIIPCETEKLLSTKGKLTMKLGQRTEF